MIASIECFLALLFEFFTRPTVYCVRQCIPLLSVIQTGASSLASTVLELLQNSSHLRVSHDSPCVSLQIAHIIYDNQVFTVTVYPVLIPASTPHYANFILRCGEVIT